jgi:hypothetical protein
MNLDAEKDGKDENVGCILLKCNQTQACREQFVNNTWLHISEEISHQKVGSFNTILEIKNVGKFLEKIKGKCQN